MADHALHSTTGEHQQLSAETHVGMQATKTAESGAFSQYKAGSLAALHIAA
jgi:hypothetical protein